MKTFMLKYRSSIYCNICDYNNHYYFNLKRETFTMDLNTCTEIAENTINYSYMVNFKVVEPLTILAKLLSIFLPNVDRPLKLYKQKKVLAAILKCSKSYAE